MFLIACGGDNQTEKTPETILSEEEMIAILTDINIMEAAINLKIRDEGVKAAQDSSLYFNIYEAHQITKEKFDESMKYYSAQPNVFSNIYAEVLNELSRRQAAAAN